MSPSAKIGFIIKNHIIRTSWMLRGYSNSTKTSLAPYDREKCHQKLQENYRETGRLIECDCQHRCQSREVLLHVIGMSINFIFDMAEHDIMVSLEQCIGRRAYKVSGVIVTSNLSSKNVFFLKIMNFIIITTHKTFTSKYCRLNTNEDGMSWVFIKEKLPDRALGALATTYPIFSQASISIEMAAKKPQ